LVGNFIKKCISSIEPAYIKAGKPAAVKNVLGSHPRLISLLRPAAVFFTFKKTVISALF